MRNSQKSFPLAAVFNKNLPPFSCVFTAKEERTMPGIRLASGPQSPAD